MSVFFREANLPKPVRQIRKNIIAIFPFRFYTTIDFNYCNKCFFLGTTKSLLYVSLIKFQSRVLKDIFLFTN